MIKVSVHKSDNQGNVYTLLEDIRHHNLTVPAGFASDGASVPRFFWRVVFPPGDSRALKAAFVHDYIYRTHPSGWDKRSADEVFRELLIAGGVPCFRANLAYCGVRLFGKRSYQNGGEEKK